MRELLWILGSGALMSAIALVGAVTLVLREQAMRRLLGPLIGLAAGSLLGAALFHLIPSSVAALPGDLWVYGAVALGFLAFLLLEQLLHWHRSHRGGGAHPVGILILVGDAMHNFLDGVAIGAAFVADIRLGVVTWLSTAAHEIPQELGDFGVLVHSGWTPRRALLYNLLSGLAFLAGGVLTWALARSIDVTLLLPFAAGTFLYIGASDLVPEIKHPGPPRAIAIHLAAFLFGLGSLFAVAYWVG